MEEHKKINEWYVLSGGPATGKTTLLNNLEMRGYAVVPEMARHCIDEQLAEGKTLQEIQGDQLVFQHEVLRHQLDAEKRIPADRLTFFDRGLPDMLAYYRYHHIAEDEPLRKALQGCSYKKVFLLEPLPLISDYARKETEGQRQALCELVRAAYQEFPFPLVTVPTLSTDERASLILSHL